MADPTAVLLAHRRQVAAIRARVDGIVGRSWAALPAYRGPQAEQWAATMVPVVEAGQAQIAAATAAYLAQYELAVTGHGGVPTRTAPVGVEALRGTAAAEVYARPFVTVWTALSNGVPFDQAAEQGLQRARNLATTDLQLAKTHTAREVLAGSRNVAGYRRLLEGSKSCGLCIVASTQRYHRDALMPIHGGCDCGVAPIYGDHDPGQVLDPGRLAEVHDAIAERFGESDAGARLPTYRDSLIVHEHGELGPVLGVRGQAYTGPSDI